MFHQKKVPKAQQPDKTPYTIHNPHTKPLTERHWPQDYYQVVSMDPSIRNFGLRIERRYLTGSIVPLAFSRTDFAPILKAKDLAKLTQEQQDELKLKQQQSNVQSDLFRDVTTFLKQHLTLYLESHIFIIERQLPHNYKAVRLSQHVISYLSIVLADTPLLPMIVEVDSKLKSRQLSCPKGMNERQTKLWLIDKAKELSQLRGDTYSYDMIHKAKKKDDLADTICQVEAWFSFVGLPLSQPVPPPPVVATPAIPKAAPVLKIVAPAPITTPTLKIITE